MIPVGLFSLVVSGCRWLVDHPTGRTLWRYRPWHTFDHSVSDVFKSRGFSTGHVWMDWSNYELNPLLH